ncbi:MULTISPECIES: hypothetical protein [Pseudonocardia]|jgi:hypothetical protein|uniref:Uncharacterized protein n=3 Tax=Pseudonocardia TaxID=1847 RepID=A0A1L8QA86_PSEAH|nr:MULTISPECIES: hypothetical protein [Pseudonocardia]OJG04399.1 hypothetical protein BG618_04282 [Pseudonocardia autotrophica]OSY35696.1 hypothetical protein BG845_05907 [Pseudonocardia autotrophica]TDN75694.1 hypothetical protein C8E95_4874 [Pseudonocardia autotrophica]BBF99666.1 hypothetical protein Pdca_08760 [Pseudonocardia autotrophica]GEC28815.1 hypothetical protein PSA01_58440 [Pseudonocardia saturnea]
MNDRYELWTPAQAVDRLAAELPGGRADAEQVVASYLRDATGAHGRPSSGWHLDEFDLDDARARFGWVDFTGGETVAAARTRAGAAAIAALREARGTSAITERDRLAGLHSDAEMWGYRAHRVGLDELTNRTACDPQPRLVIVARERSHREATAAHDARVLAAEATAEAAALDHRTDQRPNHGPDTTEHQDDEEDRVNTPDDGHPREDVCTDERSDRGRVLDEGPGAFAGGLWLTPDHAAEGGVWPLTEAEMNRVCELVRQTQADAVELAGSEERPAGRAPAADVDGAGWER